jgi:hypothetical protein
MADFGTPGILVGKISVTNKPKNVADVRSMPNFNDHLRNAIADFCTKKQYCSESEGNHIRDSAKIKLVNDSATLRQGFTENGTNRSIYFGHVRSVRNPEGGGLNTIGLKPGPDLLLAGEINKALNFNAPLPFIFGCYGGNLKLSSGELGTRWSIGSDKPINYKFHFDKMGQIEKIELSD